MIHSGPRHPLPLLVISALLLCGASLPSAPRALQVLIFAAMMAAFAAAGRRAADLLLPAAGVFSRITATITAAIALATLGAIGLGHFGLLRSDFFLLWALLAAIGAGLLPGPPPEVQKDTLAREVRTPLDWAERPLLLLAAGALAFGLIATVANAFYRSPGSFAYDDLSYHLTAMATWNRYQDLRMVKFSFGDVSTSFYPIVGEIVAWAFLAPFRDCDVAARWPELFFAVASLIGLAAVGRRIGLSPRSCAFAVLLDCTIPRVFPILALSAGNDHATAFFTLAALDGILAAIQTPGRKSAAYAGLALGLLVGTKYIGLLYAAVLLGALGLLWLAQRPRAASLARAIAVLAGTMIVLGGYTYLRNAVTTGNPIFPAPVSFRGHEILPGWEETSLALRSHLPDYRIDVPEFLTARPDLFGPLFPWTLLPAALLGPLLALVLVARRRERLATALVLATPVLFFLLFRFLMHDHRDIRYFMAGVGLAALSLSWLLQQLPPPAGALSRGFLAILAAWLSLSLLRAPGTGSVLAGGILALAGAAASLLRKRESKPARGRGKGLLWIASTLLLAGASVPLGRAVERYQSVRLAAWPSAEAIERQTSGQGTRIAYAGWNQPFPYFGRRLQNEVHFVPRSRSLGEEFYQWGGTARFPFPRGRYEAWRRNLARLGIEFVVVRPSSSQDQEPRWILRHPQEFENVYTDEAVAVWRVLPGSKGKP